MRYGSLPGACGVLGAILLIAAPGGCDRSDPSTVAEMDGWRLTVTEATERYLERFPDLDLLEEPIEEQERFLTAIVNNELLLGMARDQIETLSFSSQRQLRAARERWLVENFFVLHRGHSTISEADGQNAMRLLSREAHLQRILAPTMAAAESCYSHLEAGIPFEEAHARFSGRRGEAGRTLDLGWLGVVFLPVRVVARVHMAELEPGGYTRPTQTARGIWIIRVLDYRPVDIKPEHQAKVNTLVKFFCYGDSLAALSTKLKDTAGFRTHDENYVAVNQCFNAFWDSISAATPQVNTKVMMSWRSPIWLLDPADHDVPFFEYDGKIGTARDFMESVNDCDTEFWPSGPTRERREKEISHRIERLFVETQAEKASFDTLPDFVTYMAQLEAQTYLDELYESVIVPGITVSPEEAKAEYDRDPERWRTEEKVAFGFVTFPLDARDAALAFLNEHRDKPPAEWNKACIHARTRDPNIFFMRDTDILEVGGRIDYPYVRLLMDAAAKLETSELSDLVETEMGYSIIRCNYRRHSQPLPEHMALDFAGHEVRQQKIDRRVEELLSRERKARGARLYLERLRAAGSSTPEANSP